MEFSLSLGMEPAGDLLALGQGSPISWPRPIVDHELLATGPQKRVCAGSFHLCEWQAGVKAVRAGTLASRSHRTIPSTLTPVHKGRKVGELCHGGKKEQEPCFILQVAFLFC